uniref:Acyl-CoA dehydrogenase/oxidase C-terminal domain-containing protein n=1 Tax=Oreochromis aureus TaxID=47969 RepID=A0AAZ1XSL6_OREAU
IDLLFYCLIVFVSCSFYYILSLVFLLLSKDTAELFFEDVRLPADALLGELNKGFCYLMNELPQERLPVADMVIASCEFMFEETRNYVMQRKAFCKTVAHLQVFIDKFLLKNDQLRSVWVEPSWKTALTSTQCLQLHGGWGYMAFVDSRVQPIYRGTNEIMKEPIAINKNDDVIPDKS